jgi:hypothetical protein
MVPGTAFRGPRHGAGLAVRSERRPLRVRARKAAGAAPRSVAIRFMGRLPTKW